MIRSFFALLLLCATFGCGEEHDGSNELEPLGRGPYLVGSTNMEVAPEYVEIGDEAMHDILLGRVENSDEARFLADILKYPESAWVIDVPIPEEHELYGPAAGKILPVVTFVTYPSSGSEQRNSYAFPYHDARYGAFQDMLEPGEAPTFADPEARYPLIILAHGASAHGIYDVRHAHKLASHGYIVAVVTYGDDRTAYPNSRNDHVGFLRPLLTKAVMNSLLESDYFGGHIDAENIGITGHSFGGFTVLAMLGAPVLGNAAAVSDKRIKAGVIAAPWVGGPHEGDDYFAFGPNNSELSRITAPIICFFGTKDEVTLASFILPATRQLKGPTYVVELVDQPHVFEQGSWEDRDNWELLFFSAYLKDNAASLTKLKTARSMKGGDEDIQLFDYQKLIGND